MTTPPASPAQPAGRSAWIEWARVVACAGIVWFHAGAPYNQIALGGLVAFTALGGAFIKRISTASDLPASAKSRTLRLLAPWVVWSLIYAALRAAEALRQHEPAFAWATPEMALYGTWAHLWFLPFLFVATMLVQSADLLNRARIPVTAALGWALVLATPAFVWAEHSGLGKPLDQWVSVLPALGLGILLRGVRPGDPSARRRALQLAIVDAAAIGASAMLLPEHTASLTKHIVGGFVIFCWLGFRPASALALRLGALTLLVYLAHPLVLVLSERILRLDVRSAAIAALMVAASFAFGLMIDLCTRQAARTLRTLRAGRPIPGGAT